MVDSVVFIGVFLALIVLLFKEMKDEFNWKFKIFNSWLFQHTYIVFMIAYIILFGVLKGGQFIYFQF
jgi:ABC-type antimicrobial peptide transport system permease subunit